MLRYMLLSIYQVRTPDQHVPKRLPVTATHCVSGFASGSLHPHVLGMFESIVR
jgi:hypothetical protein